jgi:NAD(P)-dependent dehydrogenase (short-subunit alcohol dehydrogenase family)
MTTSEVPGRNVFLLGASADIGRALSERFVRDGFEVVGSARSAASAPAGTRWIPVDLSAAGSVKAAVEAYAGLSRPWDVWISCAGSMEPIGPFFGTDFDSWERSLIVNSTAQLRVLHGLYPHRRQGKVSDVVFLAGGGTNGPFRNYSAYCAAKILLIKMCELIDDEAPDLNAFIVGPGWVNTKIHRETLRKPDAAGGNYGRTLEFLNSGSSGTPMDDIYSCIRWGMTRGRPVVGGRNLSVVHDAWKGGGEPLAQRLHNEPGMFKLRRSGNPGS